MEKFKNILFKIWRVITGIVKAVTITLNMIVYTVYIGYLIYAIFAGVGKLWMNVTLAALTVGFVIFYLVLRLSKKGTARSVKHLKQYYKILKLVAKIATAITAVYALLTAIKHVHPIAIFFALFGVIFLLLRLWFGIVFHVIGRTVDKIFDSITSKITKGITKLAAESKAPKKAKAKSGAGVVKTKADRDTSNDIIIPLEDCLLSDVEDEKEIF